MEQNTIYGMDAIKCESTGGIMLVRPRQRTLKKVKRAIASAVRDPTIDST